MAGASCKEPVSSPRLDMTLQDFRRYLEQNFVGIGDDAVALIDSLSHLERFKPFLTCYF